MLIERIAFILIVHVFLEWIPLDNCCHKIMLLFRSIDHFSFQQQFRRIKCFFFASGHPQLPLFAKFAFVFRIGLKVNIFSIEITVYPCMLLHFFGHVRIFTPFSRCWFNNLFLNFTWKKPNGNCDGQKSRNLMNFQAIIAIRCDIYLQVKKSKSKRTEQ